MFLTTISIQLVLSHLMSSKDYNNTLKKVILINNNIGDLGDHGDQELNVILIASLPCFPFSHDLSVCFTDQGSFDVLVCKETLMLPQQ